MIDVHTHVLPCVDHGSASVEQSLSVLKVLAENGVSDVFCTSHYYCLDRQVQDFLTDYEVGFKVLSEANDTGVRLHRGAEVTVSRYFHYSRPARELCLGGGNRMLVELPFTKECEDWVFECLSALSSEYCIVPVIAHPERYSYVARSPKIMEKLLASGAEVQVNAASFATREAQKALRFMAKHDMIDYVASDAHYLGNVTAPCVGIAALENKRKGWAAVLEQRAERLLATVKD